VIALPRPATLVAPASIDEPECMCAEQLATFLGVNIKTVYDYAARGVIPHRRLGRRLIFSRSQVVSWLGLCRSSNGKP